MSALLVSGAATFAVAKAVGLTRRLDPAITRELARIAACLITAGIGLLIMSMGG